MVLGRSGEMVDAHGLGPCSVRIGGSSPLSGTRSVALGFAFSIVYFYKRLKQVVIQFDKIMARLEVE